MSHFIIPVTLCNNFPSHFVIISEWTKTQDLGTGTWDLELRTWYPEPRTEDSEYRNQDSGFKNLDPGPKIRDQGLDFILDTVWTCLPQMIFTKWKLFIANSSINFRIFK